LKANFPCHSKGCRPGSLLFPLSGFQCRNGFSASCSRRPWAEILRRCSRSISCLYCNILSFFSFLGSVRTHPLGGSAVPCQQSEFFRSREGLSDLLSSECPNFLASRGDASLFFVDPTFPALVPFRDFRRLMGKVPRFSLAFSQGHHCFEWYYGGSNPRVADCFERGRRFLSGRLPTTHLANPQISLFSPNPFVLIFGFCGSFCFGGPPLREGNGRFPPTVRHRDLSQIPPPQPIEVPALVRGMLSNCLCGAKQRHKVTTEQEFFPALLPQRWVSARLGRLQVPYPFQRAPAREQSSQTPSADANSPSPLLCVRPLA